MAANAKVNWYGNDVLLLVEGASDEIISKLAFLVEGEAKAAAPVDTGFMRNAIYAITPEGSGSASSQGDRVAAPAPAVGEHEAAVHGAAEYTVYQEMRVGFMYQALEKAARQAPSVIREVGRKRFD